MLFMRKMPVFCGVCDKNDNFVGRIDMNEGMEEFKIDGLTVRECLLELAEKGNRKFTASLHPGVEHILGVRVPDLRQLAKRIAKADWETYLENADDGYLEERMLQGLVLGCIRPDEDIETYLHRVTKFVWIIRSWSECDTFKFAGGKAYFRKHEARIWEYLKEWLKSSREYEVRFGVVRMMENFIDEVRLDEMFSCFEQIRQEGYYVRMAVAWALSVCFVRFPERTMDYLGRSRLDTDTFHKTLRKIQESYRVSDEMKRRIKMMGRQ